MLILGLDTAGSGASVCVMRDDVVLSLCEEQMERGQDARLIPLVLSALEKAGVSFADLDRIAVTKGPGSFTGVRVGLAAAQGLALASDKPLFGINRFALYRAQMRDEAGALLVVIASKRHELFVQLFPSASQEAADPYMLSPEEIYALGPVCVTGDALDVLGPAWPGARYLQRTEPEVITACRLAAEATLGDPLFAARPLYLRAPDVTCRPVEGALACPV